MLEICFFITDATCPESAYHQHARPTLHVSRSNREHLKRAALPFSWGTRVHQTPAAPFSGGEILVVSQKTSSAKSWDAVFTKRTKPKIKKQKTWREISSSSLTNLIAGNRFFTSQTACGTRDCLAAEAPHGERYFQ
jgi:hypothetical protein